MGLPIVYVICGPTAVGKTGISIELATRLHTGIISADSRQCYKEMTIGTAKPSKEQLTTVKHYFIDGFNIENNLNAADFERLALGYLDELFATQNTAVVCGGTGLYIKALCDGIDDMPETDKGIAANVEAGYKENGITWLQAALQQEDPAFYNVGETQNAARMIRALAFIRTTGESILKYWTNTKKDRQFKTIKIGLDLPRELLYQRINQRVDDMIHEGLVDEVKALYPLKHLKNLQTVGYRELFDFFDGIYTLPEAIEKIKQNTRNYAKRQLTWFRKDTEVHWFDAMDADLIEKILELQ